MAFEFMTRNYIRVMEKNGLSGCHDGSGNRLTKTSLITHLHDSDFNGDAQAITKNSLTTTITVFLGDFVPPPDCGNGIVRFVLYDLTKPQVASSFVQLDHVGDLVLDKHDGFTLPLSCSVPDQMEFRGK
ncbi:hypothetical protein Tco_1084435 [Tanacetum coccineum]